MELERYDLFISDWVLAKLAIHHVTEQEVEEAFLNSSGGFVKEVRPLKIAFIPVYETHTLVLKTAFPAEPWEVDEYESYT